MSIALQQKVPGGFKKETFDEEFDEATQFLESDDEEDLLGPAELCIGTCGVSCAVTLCNTITCPVTGA